MAYHRLQKQFDKLQHDADQLRSSKHIVQEKLKDKEIKTDQRLKGSIRRINYVVEEKNKVRANIFFYYIYYF
jgi:hypothetical protein